MRGRGTTLLVVVVAAVVAAGGALAARAAAPSVRAEVVPLSASDIQALVDAHNAWRTKYGVPPLAWDTKLASAAQQIANRSAADGTIHAAQHAYGENFFWAAATPHTPKFVVDYWGREVAHYNLATNRCSTTKVCGHFTQVVWKSTKKVGCALASSRKPPAGANWKGIGFYWICMYSPRGNRAGHTFARG